MKETGVGLIVLASILLFVSVIFDVSVDVTRPYVPSLSPYLPPMPGGTDNVVNLQKLQIQMMIFQGGLASFLAGMIAYAGGAIVEALPKQQPRQDEITGQAVPSPAPAPPAEPAKEHVALSPYVDGGGNEMSAGNTIALLIFGALAIIGILVAIVSLTGGSAPTSRSADNLAADAQNAINQANSDIANAQQGASDALNEMERATRR